VTFRLRFVETAFPARFDRAAGRLGISSARSDECPASTPRSQPAGLGADRTRARAALRGPRGLPRDRSRASRPDRSTCDAARRGEASYALSIPLTPLRDLSARARRALGAEAEGARVLAACLVLVIGPARFAFVWIEDPLRRAAKR
jgi:hypothetical protein